MPREIDRLTSLFVRELTILSKDYGRLGRSCWELSRVLLHGLDAYAKDDSQQGEVGDETDVQSLTGPSAPADPFQADLWEGLSMKETPVPEGTPGKIAPGKKS